MQDIVADPGPRAWLNRAAPLSGRPVIVVAEPFFLGGSLAGHVLLSVPAALLAGSDDRKAPGPNGFDNIVTFNQSGELLTSRSGIEESAGDLPSDLDLASLVGARPQSFAARAVDGETRVYAAAPLVPGLVYALGIWSPDNAEAEAITVNGASPRRCRC